MADSIQVALVCGDGESGRLLREVVRGIGRPIVHDAPVTAFDPAALALSGANVVVVDLTPDAEVDAIYDLLDDDRYRVIFNEAEVSSRLSGWEHARWARHLAAKILDLPAVIDPPRPDELAAAQDGAGNDAFVPPPPREQAEATATVEPAASGKELGIDDWLSRVMAVEDPTRRFAPTEVAEPEPDAQPPEALVPARRSSDILPAAVSETAVDAGQAIDALMQSAIVEMGNTVVERPIEPPVVAGNADWDLDDLIANIDEWLPPTPRAGAAPATTASGQAVDASRLWSPAPAPTPTSAPALVKGAVAAADARWAPQPLAAEPAPGAPQPVAAETALDQAAVAAPTQLVEAPPPAGRRLLELSPLEESALGPLFAARPPAIAAEMRVEVIADTGTVSRVVVLCASIGGPEAIRQMLGALPANYPALFLVVQHVGEEFMDMLTQQLRRSTKLRVRTADSGDQLRDGDVVPVPPRQRLVVERDGRVELHARSDVRNSGPSMDQVLRDVSDRFGSSSAAVILSGVAADAAEGCRYLAGRGGQVFVQSPASCVASSMVEQVQQTGVVSFHGTPPELAAYLLAQRN